MQIDRKQLIEEEKLRNYIRKAIKKINESKNLKAQDDESKLRSIIGKLLEADSNVAAPHRSTGINVLEDLLKKIIPQIEIEYKKLTTSPDQRASFRSHIVNAIQNSLAPVKVSDKAGSEEEAEQAIDIGLEENQKDRGRLYDMLNDMHNGEDIVIKPAALPSGYHYIFRKIGNDLYNLYTSIPQISTVEEGASLNQLEDTLKSVRGEFSVLFKGKDAIGDIREGKLQLNEEEDIEVEGGDEPTGPEAEEEFIDIDGEVEEPSEEEEKEQDFEIDGKDETGRNVAFRAFERIEQAVVDSYNILSDEDDRSLFYDYLITNIKLYFDKFEDEILTALPEPTTPEYEQEKDSQLDSGEEDLGL